MADNERALNVMLREELGLALEGYEHPLKQSLGALAGGIFASLLGLCGLFLYPAWGLFTAAFLTIALAAYFSAKCDKNRLIDAVVWNLGLAMLSWGFVYFLLNLRD